MENWLSQNWFAILNALGVIGSLVFTAVSLRSEAKTRRIANLLSITQNHRELWFEFSRRADLIRVLDPEPSLKTALVLTKQEEIFVIDVMLHVASVYQAVKDDLLIKPEGLRRDVAQFFSLPLPRIVWEKWKVVQNDDFVDFVEACLNWK